MTENPNFFLSVGKQLKDEYGRVIGKVASFALTPSGKFDAVFIEGDGKFSKRSVEHLKFDGTDITLISANKSHAKALADQIPLIWRKDEALKGLVEKKKISEELYEELHSSFDGVLKQLKNESKGLTEEMDKEIVKCSEEIKQLNYALVNLEIEHEIGKINDEAYGMAFAMIQENLKRANAEKNDVELTQNRLSNILLGETLEPQTQEEDVASPVTQEEMSTASSGTSDLPEPPVVVYVKEVGKAGI